MVLTLISDLHNKYNQIFEKHLLGGDIILCSGDMTSRGNFEEIELFCDWFSKLDNYKYKIFIAGNHDWGFQRYPKSIDEILLKYPNIIYLEDSMIEVDGVKIWGSPWQPLFLNWAFNLPRGGEKLKSKWDMIPEDTDILITHGPPYGFLDQVHFSGQNLGCELLSERINIVKPKIHLFGHIHSGNGYVFDGDTHFFNGSILDEEYYYTYRPRTINWNKESNDVEIL